jgi:hypothetical protein
VEEIYDKPKAQSINQVADSTSHNQAECQALKPQMGSKAMDVPNHPRDCNERKDKYHQWTIMK